MTPANAVLALLALALLLSGARLAWRVRARALAPGRAAIRFFGQAIVAALLWFVLYPPSVPSPTGALVVLTPGAAVVHSPQPGDRWVALPGAEAGTNIERVPDLGTALRHHPGRAPVRVLGHGLPVRDHDVAAGLPLVFETAPLPDGLLSLDVPATAVQGQAFALRGRVQGIADGVVEMLAPDGKVLASTRPDDMGHFALGGEAGLAGPTRFTLRWRDADDAVMGEETFELDVRTPARPRLLVLAGGPNPELKYLRRWAVDAGQTLHTVIELGGGVQLGDRPLPINAATLAEFDLVLLDERAWRQLGSAGRSRLRDAVREGLGVLLRITGDLSANDLATLREWGLVLEEFDGVRSLRWPGTEVADHDAPVGGTSVPMAFGTEVPPTGAAAATNPAPLLSRRPLRLSARDGRALQLAPDGETLVAWRNEGRGRVGATILTDSYRLWLSGRQAAHGQLWANTVQTLARAKGEDSPPSLPAAWLGERASLCGVSPGETVRAPDGTRTALLVDPATGTAACAGYWPTQAGLHQVDRGDTTLPLRVRDPADYPAMVAFERQAATRMLAAQAPRAEATPHERPGARWPWWLAWLLASAGLWFFERRQQTL